MIKNTDHLICFDLDGVLISSMVVANQIFYEVVETELGLPLYDYPQQKKLMALSAEDRMARLWEKDIAERGINQEQVDATLEAYRKAKMAIDIPALPMAQEVVRLLADRYEFVACVSSNPEDIIRETLRRLELLPLFSKLTGIDLIQFSKPHPEIYSSTVDYFGLEAHNAMTFEDSSHGIAAAKGAGMKVIALATGLESVEDLKKTEADIVLPDLTHFNLKLLDQLF